MTPSLSQRIEQVLDRWRARASPQGGTLALLQRVQAAIGYVPHDCLPRLAESLGVTEAQVAGVLSYYPDLHSKPTGRHLVRLCQGEACLANHGGLVLRRLCEHVQGAIGTTTPDGRYTIEQVYCVGNCGVSPTMVIDEDLYGHVTPHQIPLLLERYP
jgi:NADH:ubiquinone oxidoreductase subunit E